MVLCFLGGHFGGLFSYIFIGSSGNWLRSGSDAQEDSGRCLKVWTPFQTAEQHSFGVSEAERARKLQQEAKQYVICWGVVYFVL